MSIFKKYIFILPALFFAVNAWSQAARSPFTTFGVGEPYGDALINTQGMAGVGVSQPQFWYLNNQNPALLVFNNMTVFQAGMLVESRTIRHDTASEKSIGGNLNYLATAFPIKPYKWTTAIGLMPYTTVKFKLRYVDEVENSTETVEIQEEGSGGLTQLYWSNGVRLNKNFAVGLKTAYIFSSIKNTFSNTLLSSDLPSGSATIEEKAYVRDFALSAGVSFTKDSLFSRKKYRLSIGAVYGLAANLNTQLRTVIYRSTSSGNPADADTLSFVKGNISIPPSITAGISLSHTNKWTIGTEFSYQDWSTFKSVNKDDEGLGQSWRVAIGAETTPDALSSSFVKRITYRVGMSTEQYPFLANKNEVKDLGINFGFSLPAGRSSLDLAFKYGKRGNKEDNILEENYFKIYFGITFNDQWFVKRKFE